MEPTGPPSDAEIIKKAITVEPHPLMQRAKPEQAEKNLPPIKLRDWLQVLAHTHSNLATLSFAENPPETTAMLQSWQDGKIPASVLNRTLTLFGQGSEGNGRDGQLYLVDSDHAAHSLKVGEDFVYHADPKMGKSSEEIRRERTTAFNPQNLPRTIEQLSENLQVRVETIKALRRSRPELNGKIFTGVEVDILNEKGLLDISTPTLLGCEYVGASIHNGEYKDITGREPTLDDALEAYIKVASNPGVDVINHFIRELAPGSIQEIAQKAGAYMDWKRDRKVTPELSDAQKTMDSMDRLFTILGRQGKALEINLRDLVDPKRADQNEVVYTLVQWAKLRGVKFILGTDFHKIDQYLPEQLPDGTKQSAAAEPDKAILKDVFSDTDVYFNTVEEAQEAEDRAQVALETVFKEGEAAFGLPKNFPRLVRPVYKAIRQLQKVGIEPVDIINGSHERFFQWIDRRAAEKKTAEGKYFSPQEFVSKARDRAYNLLADQDPQLAKDFPYSPAGQAFTAIESYLRCDDKLREAIRLKDKVSLIATDQIMNSENPSTRSVRLRLGKVLEIAIRETGEVMVDHPPGIDSRGNERLLPESRAGVRIDNNGMRNMLETDPTLTPESHEKIRRMVAISAIYLDSLINQNNTPLDPQFEEISAIQRGIAYERS